MLDILLIAILSGAGLAWIYRNTVNSNISKILTVNTRHKKSLDKVTVFVKKHSGQRYILCNNEGSSKVYAAGLLIVPLYESILDTNIHDLQAKLTGFYKMLSEIDAEVELRLFMTKVTARDFIKKIGNELQKLSLYEYDKDLPGIRAKQEYRVLHDIYTKIMYEKRVPFISYVLILRRKANNNSDAERLLAELNLVKAYFDVNKNIETRILTVAELDALGVCSNSPDRYSIMVKPVSLIPYPLQYARINPIDDLNVYLGYDLDTGYPVYIPLAKMTEKHHLVIGPTGSGKTTYLATLLLRSIEQREFFNTFRLSVCIDPKGDFVEMIKKYSSKLGDDSLALRCNITDSISEEGKNQSLVEAIINDCIERYNASTRNLVVYDISELSDTYKNNVLDLILKHIYEEAPEILGGKRLLLIIDEGWRVLESKSYYFKRMVREGRSLGINLVLATQSPEDIPLGVAVNMHSYGIFGSSNIEYLEAVKELLGLGDKYLEKLSTMSVGEFLLRIPGRQAPVPLRIIPITTLS